MMIKQRGYQQNHKLYFKERDGRRDRKIERDFLL